MDGYLFINLAARYPRRLRLRNYILINPGRQSLEGSFLILVCSCVCQINKS